MTPDKSKSLDYRKVTPAGRDGEPPREYETLASAQKKIQKGLEQTPAPSTFFSRKKIDSGEQIVRKDNPADLPPPNLPIAETNFASSAAANLSYAERQRSAKQEKKKARDAELLSRDNWLLRNGHTVTYTCLYLFSVFVFFRPYELIPGLGFLQTGAFALALATLLIYLPTQFVAEGSLTIFTTEVKAILFLAGLALLTMPLAKDFGMAWATFNDIFIKAVTMFVVMVNVLRTRRRLMGIMWLSFSISLFLSYMALGMYSRGELKGDGYRVELDFGGMLNNSNDWALHLVTMIPLVVCLGIAAKSYLMRIVYFAMAALFVAACVVTYSRGGFLGLLAAGGVLAWKLGRRQRVKSLVIAAVVGLVFILLAPGNFGLRILSIFVPGMDETGSSDQRKENLILSLIVTLRNPWGIGIGCSPTFGVRNLQTHNAYTQVSSELGLAGLAAYLTFIISPLKKLAAIERTLFEKDKSGWLYYLSIGLQASLAGYMVSSFFGSVAYNWFIYYLAAYAVAFRRIYQIEQGESGKVLPSS